MKRLTEEFKVDNAIASQALGASNVTGDYFDMTKFRDALFALNSGTLADTKMIKIEIMQAKDASGTDAKAVSDANGDPIVVEFTNDTGSSISSAKLIAEVQDALMDTNNGYTHIAVKATSDDSASNVACNLIRGNSRFMPSIDADASIVA